MKTKEIKETHFVVNNLIKLRNDKGIKQGEFANMVGIDSSIWNKIESGKLELSLEKISIIAIKLNMSEIDFFTYPKRFTEVGKSNEDVKTILTIELRKEIKEQVIKLVFGNESIKILNK